MAGRKLAAYVHVDGEAYKPGTKESDLPAGVAEKITNPAAWTGGAARAASPSNADDGAGASGAEETGNVEQLPKKKADLQALAGNLGLDDGGTVAELTARIEEYYEAAQAGADASVPDEGRARQAPSNADDGAGE